jgi:hypothetical protein
MGRRELILGAGAAALGVAIVGSTSGALDFLPFMSDPASPFDRSAVVAGIGERFRVAAGEAKGVVLQITEIRDLPFTQLLDAEQQFLVRFAGPGDQPLGQGTYEFATRTFGDLPLFITPMTDPGATTAFYEAIVNRSFPTTRLGGRP